MEVLGRGHQRCVRCPPHHPEESPREAVEEAAVEGVVAEVAVEEGEEEEEAGGVVPANGPKKQVRTATAVTITASILRPKSACPTCEMR